MEVDNPAFPGGHRQRCSPRNTKLRRDKMKFVVNKTDENGNIMTGYEEELEGTEEEEVITDFANYHGIDPSRVKATLVDWT